LDGPQTLNTTTYDLAPFAGEILRGDAYCVLMSANGTEANVDIKEIVFGTLSPVTTYVPETARVDLQIIGVSILTARE